jgi:ABC transporter, phosphonate, periplasmic substrate-binding protein
MASRALLVLALMAGVAHADTITIGVFAPTEPFPSTAARVDLATRLGEHIGKALGATGNGKVYARSGDFAAAVRKGDVAVALVDAAYLAAAGGNYTVIAAAVRNGETSHGWQLVARTGAKLADLKGKRILVPSIGGRESELALAVLLGGEVARDYFAKIEAAPDASSAIAAVGLGKADAALVPAGIATPVGDAIILALPALPGPVLVAYGSPPRERINALANAAASFRGDVTIDGFRGGDPEAIRALARRFTVTPKRGPLAIPAVRLLVGDLVEGRTFAIERTQAAAFAIAPPTR